MVHFTTIKTTEHYREQHAHEVPWLEVTMAILTTKDPRKIGDKYVINDGSHYILFKLINNTAYVIRLAIPDTCTPIV